MINEKYKLTFNREYKFNDLNHIMNHVDYLFRTGSSLNRFNERTKECVVFLFGDDGKITGRKMDDDVSARVKLADMVKDRLLRLNDTGIDHLRTETAFYSSEVEAFNKDTAIQMAKIAKQISTFDDIIPYCIVGHADSKKDLHYHILYVNKGDLALCYYIDRKLRGQGRAN